MYTSVEICAGGGGQALGLEAAGFQHVALVDNDPMACNTLRQNRAKWNIVEDDLRSFDATPYLGIDLLAGGVPCPPFSIAGKQLGENDERDLFPEALRIIQETKPRAVLLENVRGLMSNKFTDYRNQLLNSLAEMGYRGDWKLLNAADFSVSQTRYRAILVAFKGDYFDLFKWPVKSRKSPVSLGDLLFNEISSLGWNQAQSWKRNATTVAPTLVGGSRKHGGPDLGPTRAKQAWAQLGVDGHGIAETPPVNGFAGMPKLTIKMAAMIQGFPDDWKFCGRKTAAYRQIGNAFPPPMARAIGKSIIRVLRNA